MIRSHDVIVSAHEMVARATIYPAEGSRRGIALLSNSHGDPHDPSGHFEELALYCQSAGITAFHLRLRAPHLFVPTVVDLRAVVAAMSERGVESVALVVEAATLRSAAFAPIAYRSIMGLVEKVIGVATILPSGRDQVERLTRSLPSDLVFLLRSARSRPDGAAARREVTRADGLSELFLAPGILRSRADGLSAIVAPVFSWAQRTLQRPPASFPRGAKESLLAPEIPDGRHLFALPSEEEYPAATAPVRRRSGARRDYQGMSATYREVCAWLAEEWQRILDEQMARDPLREASPEAARRLPSAPSAGALLTWFAGRRRNLDRFAQAQSIDAYLLASRIIAEMTSTGATSPLTDSSA